MEEHIFSYCSSRTRPKLLAFPNKSKDITNVMAKYISNNILTFQNVNYNDAFTDIDLGNIKYLKIINKKNNAIVATIRENANFTMNLSTSINNGDIPIYIVYFINTYCNSDYKYLMIPQLNQLKNLNINYKKIYIECCCKSDHNQEFQKVVNQIFPDAIVNMYEGNTYEYHGIHRIWTLAQSDKNGISLYFHSKGITRLKYIRQQQRTNEERNIFNIVITNFKQVIDIFNRFPSINKIGCGSGGIGWVWYNYWWARNDYLRQCEKPIITERRHYYEGWLGIYNGLKIIKDDCFNLLYDVNTVKFNIGSLYEPKEVCSLEYASRNKK